MNKTNLFVIFNQTIAAKLMLKGFKLIKVDKDKNNPYLNVYLFVKTDELLKSLEQIKI